jgi:hypothetical protein
LLSPPPLLKRKTWFQAICSAAKNASLSIVYLIPTLQKNWISTLQIFHRINNLSQLLQRTIIMQTSLCV